MSGLLHGLVKGEPCEVLGPNLACADEQNPHNRGLFLSGVRLIRGDGNGLVAEFNGTEWLLILCDGCLESLLRGLLPADGVAL